MRSLGRALIQCDWYLYKRRLEYRHTQRLEYRHTCEDMEEDGDL